MKYEFSAGGVVYKKENNQTIILVAQHSQHHGWVFPKGFIGDKIEGESKEDTAVREVEEETGVIGKILEPVTPVTYWYEMDGIKRRKTVYYYIMAFVDGDITKHDWEMENVEWLPMDKVEERLTYDSDKQVWQEAKEKIKNL
jgi:8-oxo-dGTP pyrophosphatase MutT (NUDIX family)